jgi:hypothetical protein
MGIATDGDHSGNSKFAYGRRKSCGLGNTLALGNERFREQSAPGERLEVRPQVTLEGYLLNGFG